VSDISKDEAEALDVAVSKVFRPAAPVDEQSLFAGRKNELRQVIDAINQPGQHVLIFGERGVGKTSLANVLATRVTSGSPAVTVIAPRVNCDTADDYSSVWRKVLSKIQIIQQRRFAGFGRSDEPVSGPARRVDETLPQKITTEDVRRELSNVGENNALLVIIDEFDRIKSAQTRRLFSDTIKTLSDHDVPATIVFVGVADTVGSLIDEHHSVARAIAQVRMPRMTPTELKEIVEKGLTRLQMTMSDSAVSEIALLSQGLPFYVHLVALCACREALDDTMRTVSMAHLERGISKALTQVQQSLKDAYHQATASPQRGNLYAHVLLACALAEPDDQGYFTAGAVREPLRRITNESYDIPTFARHLKMFADRSRGEVLRRTGTKHRIRYRFDDPLMQPYILMRSLSRSLLTPSLLESLSLVKARQGN
jgi:Cdc6-like AAA superfamily ATPase